MPDIATVLKSEISRIARKEIRSETDDFKKVSSQYRSHIADLRRRIDALERQLKKTTKASARSEPAAVSDDSDAVQRRFSPARLAATRKKLDLSAADFGALIGVTGQSIYKWESGEARPRSKQLDAIASVRGIGKREAAARLEVIRAAE
jgi:DNA-binding transcriptional regulator YiaG